MQELEIFLKKIPTAKFYTTPFYKSYLQALELFWFQKRRDALSFIAQTIQDHIDHEDLQVFYRLWIEVLAETHDRLSLQMLKNHLATMAPQYADYDQWAALRGLVHLELEELDACAVILRGVGENTFSPYAMELRQRYEFRFSEDGKTPLSILECEAPITDYFILRTLALGALTNGDVERSLLSKISQNFPQSPLADQFLFWQRFEENKVNEAIKVAERLAKRFPENEDFKFNLAYAFFCEERVDEAVHTLESFGLKTSKKDPDTMALLGYGYLRKSKGQKESKEWQKAKSYFTLAKAQADKIGIPSSEILVNLHYMTERKKSSTTEGVNFWTLPISARRESELMQNEERDIDFVFHEISKEVQDNDFVFVTGDKFRVLSLYKVIHKAVWHPYEKNQGLLELVYRFPRSISMPALRDLKEKHEGMVKLSAEDAETWLKILDEHAPLRQKMSIPAKKEPLLQIRKSS